VGGSGRGCLVAWPGWGQSLGAADRGCVRLRGESGIGAVAADVLVRLCAGASLRAEQPDVRALGVETGQGLVRRRADWAGAVGGIVCALVVQRRMVVA